MIDDIIRVNHSSITDWEVSEQRKKALRSCFFIDFLQYLNVLYMLYIV